MHIEIVPFRDTHLEEAAELLALRHQGDHALEQALPERFTQSAVARAAVEAAWSKPNASGVVALYAGRMIGYLIGVPRIDLVWGRSIWVSMAGHAVDQYRRLSKRRGSKRAAIAVGHSILVIYYHMVKTGEPYQERGSST